jgi:hypothetical protein
LTRISLQSPGKNSRRGTPRRVIGCLPAAGRGRGAAGVYFGGSASHSVPWGNGTVTSSTWACWWGWQRSDSVWSRPGRSEPKHLDRPLEGTATDPTRRLQRHHWEIVPTGDHNGRQITVKINICLANNVGIGG